MECVQEQQEPGHIVELFHYSTGHLYFFQELNYCGKWLDLSDTANTVFDFCYLHRVANNWGTRIGSHQLTACQVSFLRLGVVARDTGYEGQAHLQHVSRLIDGHGWSHPLYISTLPRFFCMVDGWLVIRRDQTRIHQHAFDAQGLADLILTGDRNRWHKRP